MNAIKPNPLDVEELSSNCKNCNTNLDSNASFCHLCGARVIKERITLKYMLIGLLSTLGWDNGFWKTFWHLIIKPRVVFEKYLSGTRKLYTAPLSFFAIITTVFVLAISFCTDDLIELTTNVPFIETNKNVNPTNEGIDIEGNEQTLSSEEIASDLEKQQFFENMGEFMYKYYYYLNFLFLPFYALLAFLVFGKPNNYAEHLVINAYISGPVAIMGLLLITLSLRTNSPGIFYYGQYIVNFSFYVYAYQAYRKYSFKQMIIKILRFFAILIIMAISITILAVVSVIIYKLLKR